MCMAKTPSYTAPIQYQSAKSPNNAALYQSAVNSAQSATGASAGSGTVLGGLQTAANLSTPMVGSPRARRGITALG